MQKTKGLVSCQVRLSSGKASKLEAVITGLSKSVRVSNVQLVKNKNQNMLVFNAEYGSVWGGWISDIRKHVRNAMEKTGSTATLETANEKRIVVERR